MTEEAGSLAWGAPEVIGEIEANNEQLANEYYQILYSYIFDNPNGPDNYLEFDELRKEVYWGLARLSQNFPDIAVKDSKYLIERYSVETNSEIKGILCWISGLLKLKESRDFLKSCIDDNRKIHLYKNYKYETTTVSALSQESMALLDI